jgi:hypothetical protein
MRVRSPAGAHRERREHTPASVVRALGCLLGAAIAFAAAGCAAAPRPEVLRRIEQIDEAHVRAHIVALATEIGPRSALDATQTGRAVAYLEGQLRAFGYDPHEEVYYLGGARQCNVIAELPGTLAHAPVLEIGAHYDTVPLSPGADDNASGVAAVLEVARAAAGARCERTLRFCLFSAEEPDPCLIGSGVHVFRLVALAGGIEPGEWAGSGLDAPPREWAETCHDALDGAIVLDGVGYRTDAEDSQRTPARIPLVVSPPSRGDFVAVIGNFASSELGSAFEDAADRYVPDLSVYSAKRVGGFFRDASRSDHASYWRRDLRGILVTDTGPFRAPTYHDPSDLAATLDFAFLARIARAVAAAALERAGMRS